MYPSYQRRSAPSPFSYPTGGVGDDGSFAAPSYSHPHAPIEPSITYHGPAGGVQSDGLSVGGIPYLPPAYKAPSPQYIDQASRASLDAENRQFRQTNFQNSTLRANDPNSPQSVSQGVFSAQRRQFGATRAEADAAAYGVRHGAPFQPQGYGQIGQPGPTIVIPPYGGSRAGGGQPYSIPGGADVMTPGAAGTHGMKPYNPSDRANIRQRYLGQPIYAPGPHDDKGFPTGPRSLTGYSNYPNIDPGKALETAGNQADKDLTGNAPQPSTQPSEPAAPMNAQKGPEEAYGDKTKIGLTEEHARAMWDVIRHANPNAPLDSLGKTFARTLGQYGIKGQAAQNLVQQWTSDGSATAPQQQAQTQVVPGAGARTPVSMLGTDNGLPRGPQGNGLPGPTVNAPATVTTQPGLPQNQQGYTPITAESGAPQTNQPAMTGNPAQPARITRAAAGMYLQQAGGDPAKAKAMIQQHGFDLSAGYAD